ncbi:type II toxin-antitoxin system VapC family toxin [Candidatus Caldatribacterium saccharofermentans]|uniref:type II toxin-antitoxin system VapC family toxin n=1 Tax=Candidatus Caldatribacterium saccharofermentans TaxID=1454753 RepID=UPI003CFD5DDA
MKKVFVDTNILIYFLEQHERFFSRVRHLFLKAEKGEIVLCTSSLSYFEVLIPVVAKKDHALRAGYHYLFRGFPGLQVYPIDTEAAEKGAEIRVKYNLKTPDALQVGCALAAQCQEFFTADRALTRVQEIPVVLVGEE